jgi:hypothetical protein
VCHLATPANSEDSFGEPLCVAGLIAKADFALLESGLVTLSTKPLFCINYNLIMRERSEHQVLPSFLHLRSTFPPYSLAPMLNYHQFCKVLRQSVRQFTNCSIGQSKGLKIVSL